MSETLMLDSPLAWSEPTPAESSPKLPRVLALANQKGGVGKTTTAINLGTALAAIGEQVLILDLDPQGNASTGLGIDRRNRRCSTYHVMAEAAPLRDAITATEVPRLSIAPSTLDLSGFDLEVGRSSDRAFRLRRALEQLNAGAPDATQFSYVLIDSPPSLNLLTINAMAAANAILVPLQCEFFALEGLSQLMKTVEQVKQSLNPDLIIHGIVLTMYDSRNNLSAQVVADVREFMGRKVYDTVIPRNVRISEAPSYGKPVLVYDLKCAGSEAYLRLATEIIQREKELLAGDALVPAQPAVTALPAEATIASEAPPSTEAPPLQSEQTNNQLPDGEQANNHGPDGEQTHRQPHDDQTNDQTNNSIEGS